jgi:hypothetical protein
MSYQIILLRVLLPLHRKLRPACLYHGSPALDSRRAEHQRSSGRIHFSRRRDPGSAPASQLVLCLQIAYKSCMVQA